ncbi:carbohydrate kinase family protein [Desulfovibrio inopinatus]|uniref:carbohydrate kinase family protein n=1 Tax=Desulfovibrio inopinatus TaxID=102109 RepID=UPI00041C81E8|nr:carbohydrate kinase family protein [Desulfovibrio inopinatus]
MRIFISGSLAYDRIMTFPGKFADHILPEKIHILNVCFLVDNLEEKFGGTAGNIAYSLSLLGEDPTVLATTGKDFDRYEAWLKECGISMEGMVNVPTEFTAGAYITTDMSDNQITGFNMGAMKYPSNYAFHVLDPADTIAIAAPGNLEDMKKYMSLYKEKGIRCIFDPGQNIPAFKGPELVDMLTGASILISNDYELELIMNSTGLTKTEILERTPVVITTLGEKGCLISESGSETQISAAKVKTVKDPTGAGDGFRAGLIKGLCMGKCLPDAAKIGAISAAYAVEHYGTQEHRYTEDEFWKRFADNFGAI